jgi:mono/diheme cytochrome c family protein
MIAAAFLLLLVRSSDDLKPGLVASYRSREPGGGVVERVDPKPAFTLGHSSPHPRLPPGRFEAVWTGLLLVQEADEVAFDAFVGGELRVELDGAVVLEGQGTSDTHRIRGAPAPLQPGLRRFRAEFRSLPGVPARLQLGWEGKRFSREPLPAWRFRHAERPESLAREDLVGRGREAAGRLGCARCHRSAFPGVTDPPPGPSLADAAGRLDRTWLIEWLERPHRLRPGARMPALFSDDRPGYVERWIVAQTLAARPPEAAAKASGDARAGRREFVSVGCAACHLVPDLPADEQPPLGRTSFEGLVDRFTPEALAAFLGNPRSRYPDGRMPRIPVSPEAARDLAAYLLRESRPRGGAPVPPEPREIEAAIRRLRVSGIEAAGRALVTQKRCAVCHPGLGDSAPADVPLRRIGPDCTGARFDLDDATRRSLEAYGATAAEERHPSPFEERRRLLERYGCGRCHARDAVRAPPLEEAGSTLGGAYLQYLPFLRAPRLEHAFSKYTREYLAAAIREGVAGVRHSRFSYRMPAFDADTETILRALAEADGDLPEASPPPALPSSDPTLAPLGPALVGFEGYSCVSCHLWKGRLLNEPDPGAIGPELTTATRRVRRDWFDRWLEDPARIHPGTPMPQIFKKGEAATLRSVLDGDAVRQREALWAYLSLGPEAPSPKPLPPLEVFPPEEGGPRVAQIPVTLPDRSVVESITVLYADHDLFVYDVGTLSLRAVFTGARLLRRVRGRVRTYEVTGTAVDFGKPSPGNGTFLGYDRRSDGVRIRTTAGEQIWRREGRRIVGPVTVDLPPPTVPPPLERSVPVDSGTLDGALQRPGYRAVAYPRPKLPSGEDRVMPGAIAADPRDGRVYVASMKLGELFAIRDPGDDGRSASFEDWTGGLFQEAYAMLAEPDGVYVLHRRNLTRVTDTDGDGKADRFDRVAALPQAPAEVYDYGYGLARDRSGAFVLTFAPYGNRSAPGSGSLLRLVPGKEPPWEETAFGFRNPLGWCAGPDGEIFFTDNQGEWVATNKLCHAAPGRFYGFPNPQRREDARRPPGKAAVWIPYAWAKSVNGAAYDGTGGRFGPFAGQIFLAELMYGGAILRASLERVNGEYQGACFPFWGRGLLGPLCLAFDPKGRLWVGAITEPGWMAQPDRGAVYRIEFTGEVPFEIREIRVRPRGFRLVFTRPVDPATAADPAAYQIEHYRYEYTGAYGSPELDRTRAPVEKAEVSADRLYVDLTLPPLVRDRVYLVTARGVRSEEGEPLVHPAGAYTLHEIPR